jgi:hypothetical protein
MKKPVRNLSVGNNATEDADFVIAHARWRNSRKRRPSMAYKGELNPRKALELAFEDVDEHSKITHNVVFRTIVGTHRGVITWTAFRNKKYFDKWYDKKMKFWYEIVIEGVSRDRAVECCSTPESNMAVFLAQLREANKCLEEVVKSHRTKYPPISNGTLVITTQANESLRREWTDEVWEGRQWGVNGEVITHHDSHGLSYEVRHPDGTIGHYDPSELEVL